MFIRAFIYATLFVGIILLYVPANILSSVGIVRPSSTEISHIVGMIFGLAGALIALWCVITFVVIGKGTPAPFDPPRQLVTQGPYRFVRNPMYIGAGIVLGGAALYYESLNLLLYAMIFFIVAHLFVIWYEEPTLERAFGQEYEIYCRKVKRWWPTFYTQDQ